jgi:hypothetical protein
MRNILDRIPGSIRLGGFWRVPVVSMPPEYLVARGLIRPADFNIFGSVWKRMEKPSGASHSTA